jgi:hypothetical protein
MVRACCQSNHRDNQTRANRIAGGVHFGVMWWSLYRASCLRRNRFSAARAGLGRKQRHRKRKTSMLSMSSVEARSITAWITSDRRSIAVGPRDVVSTHQCLLSWLSAPMSSAIVDADMPRDRHRPGPLITLKHVEILFLRITTGSREMIRCSRALSYMDLPATSRDA